MVELIQAADIFFAHGGNQIFEGLTLSIQERDRIALIGENGSGKSTLFRLLTRELAPQRGTVTHKRGIRIGYVHQDSNLDPASTVREVLARAAGDPDALEWELLQLEDRLAQPLTDDAMEATLDAYNDVLGRLDAAQSVDVTGTLDALLGPIAFPEQRWDQRIGDLSGGERKLVDLAQHLFSPPDVMLLDEPENHFDIATKAWLEGWLAESFRGAAMVISHDRYMIDRVAKRIVELEDGRLQDYPGNYSAYLDQREARILRQQELHALAEREYLKLKASAEELTQWARQNPKFASRAEQQRNRMAAERARLDAEPVPVLNRRRISLSFSTERSSTDIVVAEKARIDVAGRILLRPFDLQIRHGERVGLIGPNGAGKTTLVRAILGQHPVATGTIRLGTSVNVGYYSQHHETLPENETALDLARRTRPLTEQQAIGFLNGLLFDRDDAMRPIRMLSGGERARLQIGLLVLQGANLLFLDEPTNNLDLGSVEILEGALRDFPGAILTISHDRYYLDHVCTRTLLLEDGAIRDFAAAYSWTMANPEKGTWLTRDLAFPAATRPSRRNR